MLFIVCLWPHLPFLDIIRNLKSREKLSIYLSVHKQSCSKEVSVLIFWTKGSKRKMEEVGENLHEPEKSIEDGLIKQKTAGMLLPMSWYKTNGNFQSSRWSATLYGKRQTIDGNLENIVLFQLPDSGIMYKTGIRHASQIALTLGPISLSPSFYHSRIIRWTVKATKISPIPFTLTDSRSKSSPIVCHCKRNQFVAIGLSVEQTDRKTDMGEKLTFTYIAKVMQMRCKFNLFTSLHIFSILQIYRFTPL